jgi:hypothetical protein
MYVTTVVPEVKQKMTVCALNDAVTPMAVPGSTGFNSGEGLISAARQTPQHDVFKTTIFSKKRGRDATDRVVRSGETAR